MTTTNPPVWTDEPSYKTVHWRLMRIHGPSSNYLCVCGEPALDWCYYGGSPSERSQVLPGRKTPSTYSLDLGYYQPLCRLHHRAVDRWR